MRYQFFSILLSNAAVVDCVALLAAVGLLGLRTSEMEVVKDASLLSCGVSPIVTGLGSKGVDC